MKNYEEMAHDVFQRINEYNVRKKKQRKMVARTATTVCPACIIAVAGFGIWQNGGFSPNDNMFTESSIVPEPENDVINAIIVTTTSGELTLKTDDTTHTEIVTSVNKNTVSSSYVNERTTASNIKNLDYEEIPENNPALTSGGISDDIVNNNDNTPNYQITDTDTLTTSSTNTNNVIINTTATAKKPDNQGNNTTVTTVVTDNQVIETSDNTPVTTVVTDSQVIETSDNTPVTTVDTNVGVTDITSGEQVVITGGNGTAQIVDSFNMNGFDYVEVREAKGRTFTTDQHLIMSDSERDVFTVKESKYLLLVKKSSGETVLFTVLGSISVNGRTYSETQISSDNYTEENYLGLAGDFEIISTPFNSVYIGEDEEIFTVKENEQFILLKSSDGETRVFAAF